MKGTRFALAIFTGFILGAVLTLLVHAGVGIIRFWLGV